MTIEGKLPLSLEDYENCEYWKLAYLEDGVKSYFEEKEKAERKRTGDANNSVVNQGGIFSKLNALTSKFKMPSFKMPKM